MLRESKVSTAMQLMWGLGVLKADLPLPGPALKLSMAGKLLSSWAGGEGTAPE